MRKNWKGREKERMKAKRGCFSETSIVVVLHSHASIRSH